MPEIRWVVSSSMDYGECAMVNGVFTSEELANEWVKNNADKDFGYHVEEFTVDLGIR